MNAEPFIIQGGVVERAVRLELTIADLQSGALAAWRRAPAYCRLPIADWLTKECAVLWMFH